MSDVYEIPLVAGAQKFVCTLGDKAYLLQFSWRTAEMGGWTLDILDSVTEEPIVAGILLTVGNDLLAPYAHFEMGHLVALLDSKKDGHPTYEDMGSLLKLFWRA